MMRECFLVIILLRTAGDIFTRDSIEFSLFEEISRRQLPAPEERADMSISGP